MSSISSRLKLYEPTDSDIVDVDPINDNSFQLDDGANVTPFSGSDYPSGFNGQLFYRTDTKTLFRSDASGSLVPYLTSATNAPDTLQSIGLSAQSLQSTASPIALQVGRTVVNLVPGNLNKLLLSGTIQIQNNGGSYSNADPRIQSFVTFAIDTGNVSGTLNNPINRFCHYSYGSSGQTLTTYLSFHDEVTYIGSGSNTVTLTAWYQIACLDTLVSGSAITAGMAQGSNYSTTFGVWNLGQAGGIL